MVECWQILLLPRRRNKFSLLLEGSFIRCISEKSFLAVLYDIIYRLEGSGGGGGAMDGGDGRRLGGPAGWKTLPPGKELERGSISTGANVATASLELWCKEHCITPSASTQGDSERMEPLEAVKQTEDYPYLYKTNPSIWVRHCCRSEIGLL